MWNVMSNFISIHFWNEPQSMIQKQIHNTILIICRNCLLVKAVNCMPYATRSCKLPKMKRIMDGIGFLFIELKIKETEVFIQLICRLTEY